MDSKDATNLLSTKTLVKFGLNRQPFMDKGSNRYVFEDSAISTQLNVLINIIHGSDKIVMIKGENGIGKSSLLLKLAKTRHKGLTFCPITATDKITIEGICKIALKQLEIQAPSSNASIPEFFAKRVAFRRRTEGKTVLLIDNADQLDSYTIDQLLLLRKLVAEDGVPAISIVFAGHPQLEQILTALPRINSHLSILHTIYLYPFSEKQTEDYINQRLQFASNESGIDLLSPAQIQSIHTKAKGIPALINYETCRVLETVAGNKQKSDVDETDQSGSSKTEKLVPAALIAVATVSLAFIGYLVYGHFQSTSPAVDANNIAETAKLPTKKVTPFKPEQPPVAVEPTTNANETAQEPEVVAVIPVAEPAPFTEPKVNEVPATEPKQLTEETAEAIDGSKPKAVEPKQKATVESTAAVTKPVDSVIDKPQVATTETTDKTSKISEVKDTDAKPAQSKPAQSKPSQSIDIQQKTIASTPKQPAEVAAKEETKPKVQQQPKKQPVIAKPSKPAKTETPKQVAATKPVKTEPVKKEPIKTEPKQAEKPRVTAVNTKPAKAKPETKIKPRPKPTKPVVKKAETAKTVTQWIKSQPGMNYTMQLLAAQEKTALEKYRTKHPSLKDAKIAHTLRKGKEWYVLIIGSFKTTKEANAFLKKQPKPISTSKPWIRRFKPLQNTLK